MLYATGISEMQQLLLNDLGISVCYRTCVRISNTLAENERLCLKSYMRLSQYPGHLTLDNFDIWVLVRKAEVDSRSHDRHGTWGFLHIPPGTKLSAYSLENLRKHRAHLDPLPFNIFVPDAKSEDHFRTVFVSLMADALAMHCPQLRIPPSKCHPQPVKPLPVVKPIIFSLQLMDESDNSIVGVGEVQEAVCRQLGLDRREFSNTVRLINCDVGTASLFEGLRKARAPARTNFDSLDCVETILGGAHTLWVAGTAVARHYWGNEKNGERDSGRIWRLFQAAGRKPIPKKGKIKDFNALDRDLTDILYGMLLECFW